MTAKGFLLTVWCGFTACAELIVLDLDGVFEGELATLELITRCTIFEETKSGGRSFGLVVTVSESSAIPVDLVFVGVVGGVK